jgi:hypothetical protein
MKYQYFGDVKDLFKYDLLLHLLKSTGSTDIAFISMLTIANNPNQGKIRNYNSAEPGYHNHALLDKLKNIGIINSKKAYEDSIKSIFEKFNVKLALDDFKNSIRKLYFGKVSNLIKSSDIIFFDPDTGIQQYNFKPTKNKEEFIKYRELFYVMSQVYDNSCVVVIQFHKNIKTYSDKKFKVFSDAGYYSFSISNSKVAFFLLQKNKKTHEKYLNIVSDYSKSSRSLRLAKNKYPVSQWHSETSIGTLPVRYLNETEIYKISKPKLKRVDWSNRKLLHDMDMVNVNQDSLLQMFYDEDGNILYKTGVTYYMLDLRIDELAI